MNISEHLLFEKDLFKLRDEYKRLMEQDIRGLTNEYVLSADIDEICADLVDKFGFDIPILSDSADVLPSEEVTVSRRESHRGTGRELIHYSGTKIEYVIPFTGKGFLFDYRVEVHNHRPIKGLVVEKELHLPYLLRPDFRDMHIDQIGQEFKEELDEIKKYLEWNRGEAHRFNAELDRIARSMLESRRNNHLKLTSALSNMGFRMRRREDAPDTYKPPVERRELPIRKPGVSPLPMKEYEHILSVMTNMVSVMERSPRAFVKMEEEDLRIHFLVQLNAQYEGQATGETFNLEGKTDILIRINNQNIFVAECKYWKGEKAFLEAIDQLFRYLTWRDTKAAIVLFNTKRNPTRILNQIPTILMKHSGFIEQIAYESYSGFRCRLHHPEDIDKEVLVTALLFNVPT